MKTKATMVIHSKRLSILFLLVFVPALSNGQTAQNGGKYRGEIRDRSSNAPLEDVYVILNGTSEGTIHKVSLDEIDLRIDVTLKNPSGGSVKVKHPFVKMIYGGVTVASSQIKDVNITIPKYSEVNLEPVMINIGFMSLATTVPGLFKEYRNTGKLSITVKTITTINDSLPYTKTDSYSEQVPDKLMLILKFSSVYLRFLQLASSSRQTSRNASTSLLTELDLESCY